MRICILAELTLMLAWSHEEAGKILEVYKVTQYDLVIDYTGTSIKNSSSSDIRKQAA